MGTSKGSSQQEFGERSKTSFEYTLDASKQIITISSAIIALSITFAKDFAGGVEGFWRIILTASWVLFLASIFLGLLTNAALIGDVDPGRPGSDTSRPLSVYEPQIQKIHLAQWVAFMIAIVLASCVFLFAPDNDHSAQSTGNIQVMAQETIESIQVQATVEAYMTAVQQTAIAGTASPITVGTPITGATP